MSTFTAYSALYTEMSDHPDTTALEAEFASTILANPVIQTLIAEQPIPITANRNGGHSLSHIPFINYTRAVRNGYILPSLAHFSNEQLTDAIGLLNFWQFPDSDATKLASYVTNQKVPRDTSAVYWKDVLIQERDLRILAATAASIPPSATLEVPKSLRPLLFTLDTRIGCYFHLPLIFPDILGLHGYSNPWIDAMLGRSGSFHDDYCIITSLVYGSYPVKILHPLQILRHFAVYGDVEMLEWACQSESIKECLPGHWTHSIAHTAISNQQTSVLQWLKDNLNPTVEDITDLMSVASCTENASLSVRWFCEQYPALMTPELFHRAIWHCPAALKELIAVGCPFDISVCHEAILYCGRYGNPDIIHTLRDAGCPWDPLLA
jgi:hypothetical protein